MKKAISLLLVLVLCLSLCACGGVNETPNETGSPTASTAPTKQESQNSKNEPTHNESPTQAPGRIETDHALFSYLFGTWELQNEDDAESNPYTKITFNEDGTCIIDGAEYRWVIFEEKETMLLFNILSENEKIAGASLSCNKAGLFSGFMAMGKENYNFCPGVWENTSQNNNNESTASTTEPTISDVDLTNVILNNIWPHLNHPSFTRFREDGTTTNYGGTPTGTWVLDGTTIKCFWNDGSTDDYEVKNINGTYLLVGNNNIMTTDCFGATSSIDWNSIPQKTIEITLENWNEYFELAVITKTTIQTDMWGENQEVSEPALVLKLKDAYYRIFCQGQGNIAIRCSFSCWSEEKEAIMTGETSDESYYNVAGFIFANDKDVIDAMGEDFTFEVIRIKGTLHLVDGI